jgi:hypothetical protein
MKITRDDDLVLEVLDPPNPIGIICVGLFAVMLGWLAFVLPHSHPDRDKILALAFGTFLFGLGGVMFSKKSEFRFEKPQRRLVWYRRGLFGRFGGEVAFADLVAVEVESITSSNSGRSRLYRVVLRLPQGTLPVTDAYGSGTQKLCEAIADRIRAALKNPAA